MSSSVLSSLLAIRFQYDQLCKESPQHPPKAEQVGRLFSPLLEAIAEKDGGRNQGQWLMDVLSHHIIQECSDIGLDKPTKRAIECQSIGNLNAGPFTRIQDPTLNILSFLNSSERATIERVCKYLFILSRRTPILCEKYLFPRMKHPRWQSLRIKELCVLYEYHYYSQPPIPELFTDSIETIVLDTRCAHWSWLLSFHFPNLRTLKLRNPNLNEATDPSWLVWELIDQNHITELFFEPKNEDIKMNSGVRLMLKNISHRQSVIKLYINAAALSEEGDSQRIDEETEHWDDHEEGAMEEMIDFSHLRSVHLVHCRMPMSIIQLLTPVNLEEFASINCELGKQTTRHFSQPVDWSYFQLPNLKRLSLSMEQMARDKGVLKMMEYFRNESCSSEWWWWMKIEELFIETRYSSVSELCELIEMCTLMKSMRKLVIRLGSVHKRDWESRVRKMHQFWKLLNLMKESEMDVQIGVMGVGATANDLVCDMIAQSWRMNKQRGQSRGGIQMRVASGCLEWNNLHPSSMISDDRMIDRIKQDCCVDARDLCGMYLKRRYLDGIIG